MQSCGGILTSSVSASLSLNHPMQPSPESSQPSSPSGEDLSALDLAFRAAFLEAFVRELTKDTPGGDAVSADLEEGLTLELNLPENGYRPVNRMAGLS